LRAKALNAAGFLSFYHGDYEQGKILNGKALAIYRELGDKANSAWALAFLSSHSMGYPDRYKEGMTLCEEGLALFRELSDKPGMAQALTTLGELARLDGDYERARTAYEECLAVCRETGMKRREAITLGNLAYVAQHQGNHGQAEALVREGLILLRELGFKYAIAIGLALLAGPVGAKGQPERAARLFGASEAFLEAMGIGQQAGDQSEVDRYVAAAREQLDEATFEATWAKGRAMSLEQAIEYALWEGDDD
jgi:tetratricopeptide (TPR) repeat protein